MIRGVAMVIATGLVCVFAQGCGKGTGATIEVAGQTQAELVESAEPVRGAYNGRVEQLGVLWSRGIVAFRYRDADGNRRDDQGNANVQLILPDEFAMRIHKVGETLLWIGADEERYWMIDLLSDPSRAYFGRHELFTSAKGDRVGLPVPPRELPTLMGLRPLPAFGEGTDRSRVRSISGRAAVIEVPGRWGWWVYRLDGEGRAEVIQLRDGEDRVLLEANLEQYMPVELRGIGGARPQTAGRVRLTAPGTDWRITMELDAPSNRRPNPEAFDFEELVDVLGPSEVINLDAPPAPGDGA
jgi:hypothetical protein